MKKSDINPMPPFFDRYINIIEDIDIFDAFEKYAPENVYEEMDKISALNDNIYAPGKWTTKDIFQHVIDNERIMAYRALRFSRNDKTPLAGYDEEPFAAHTNAVNRTLPELIREMKEVRMSTISLYKGMTNEMMQRTGTANDTELTPLALGFVILGHPVHHMNIIRERYFPLLS